MAVSADIEAQKVSKLYDKAKELAGENEELLNFVTKDVCKRHLIARKWNEHKAEAMIKETLHWRGDYRPNNIKFQEINEEVCSGKLYIANYTDKKGNPVIVMRPRNQNTKDHEDQIRLLVYTLERAVAMNKNSGSGKFIWLIDFTGYTSRSIVNFLFSQDLELCRNAPTFKASKATLKILQSHYPERLEKAILFNPPSLFLMLWRLLSPFIDPITRAKVVFVPKKKATEIFTEHFELSELESQLTGQGDVKSYDHESYCALHSRLDEYYNGTVSVSRKTSDAGKPLSHPASKTADVEVDTDADDDELPFFDACEDFPIDS